MQGGGQMSISEEIRQMIERKEFSKAKQMIENIENEVEKYFLLGVVNYHEMNFDNAIEMFKKVLEIDPTHSETLFYYSKSLFGKDEYFESWRYLTRITEKSPEIWDMLGDTQLRLNNPAMALHYYKKAYESSNDPNFKQKYENIRTQNHTGKKLAIFCLPGLDSFIHDIADVLSYIYDVKLTITTNSEEILQTYTWADIVWLEWANQLAYEITNKLPKNNKKIICRLHGYEALAEDLNLIKWDLVDHIIFVAHNVQNTAYQNFPELTKIPASVVYNGINLTKYKFKNRKKGKNLVFLGHFNYKKNPVLAAQILKKLVEIDADYKFYWAGSMQTESLFNYIGYITDKLGISDRFFFEGFKTNIDEYLEDKDIFFSTSIHEGYGVAILEAMTKGIKPVIHNFYIAEEFYPKDFIFNTIDEAVEMITSEDYDSVKYRKFVEDKSSLEQQIKQISDILSSLGQVHNKSEEKTKFYFAQVLKTIETGEQFFDLINEFMTPTTGLINTFDFSQIRILTGKFEKISDEFFMLDFILTNDKRNLVIVGILVNPSNLQVIYPYFISNSINFGYIEQIVKQILSLELKKIPKEQPMYSFIYDERLYAHIKANEQAYTWERGLIGTQFMPIRGLINVAFRYVLLKDLILKSDNVLEAGCGFGYGASYISNLAQKVTGLDIAEDSIEFCKKTYPISNVEWIIGDVTNLPFENETFDVYVSYETLEHIPLNLVDKYVEEAYRVLKKGGRFIISTPNKVNRTNINNPFHIKEYTFGELKTLLESKFKLSDSYSLELDKLYRGISKNSTSMIIVTEK